MGLDDSVVQNGKTVVVNLGETTLVDKFLHGLEVGVTVGDVGLDQLEHVLGGLVQLNEGAVSGLEKTEQLEYLSGLGVHLRNTTLDSVSHNGKEVQE